MSDEDRQSVTFQGGDGIITRHDFLAYWDVLQEAFAIHIDREAIRHGLWKDYPAGDQAGQIKTKVDRVLRSLELIETMDPESAEFIAQVTNVASEMLDIINYAVFTVRKMRGE
jgi:hypothetical protein